MKNKLLLPLLLLAVPLTAQVTVTPNIGLQVPYYGQTNWQVPIQYDLNQLDLLLSGNSPLPGVNTWSSTYTYPSGAVVTYSGAPYVSLQAANIGHNPSSATAWWYAVPLTASPFSIVPGTNITCTPLVSGSCTGVVTVNAASTLSTPFSSLSSSANISAAMVVGSGASLAPSGTGTITATSMPYSGLTGTVPTWNQNTTGTAATATNVTGTVAIANGGTGATTATGALSNLGAVSTTTTVNGHALSGNVVVSASDLTTGTLPAAQLPVATTSTLGGVKTDGSTISNASGAISCTTATSSQIGCMKLGATGGADAYGAAAAVTLSGLGGVPTTTTVNGHALSSNVTVSASDLTTGTLPHAQLPTLVSGDIPNNAANTTGNAATATYATTAGGAPPTGSASGDLSGSYPGPSVVKVNGAAVPTSKTIVGTNSSGQIVDASSTTIANNTTGTAANLTDSAVLPSGTTISGITLTAATFNFGYVGVPGANQSLGYIPQAGTTATIPSGCTGSYAFGSVASSTTDVFTITNCTSGASSCSTVGTVTFTSSASGVYSCSGSFTVAPGGSLTITGPATATITNPSFAVYGVHN